MCVKSPHSGAHCNCAYGHKDICYFSLTLSKTLSFSGAPKAGCSILSTSGPRMFCPPAAFLWWHLQMGGGQPHASPSCRLGHIPGPVFEPLWCSGKKLGINLLLTLIMATANKCTIILSPYKVNYLKVRRKKKTLHQVHEADKLVLVEDGWVAAFLLIRPGTSCNWPFNSGCFGLVYCRFSAWTAVMRVTFFCFYCKDIFAN